MRLGIVVLLLCVGLALATTRAVGGQQVTADGPRYQSGDALELPTEYRAWPFIGAGLGMTYEGEEGTPAQVASPTFSHAFVNPSSYTSFLKTGVWPNGTVFVLEFRQSATEGSINVGGRFATNLVQLEAEVKDSRFEDGWAYYVFGQGDSMLEVADPLPPDQATRCVECHSTHGAVERTFVQFYPTLLDVAREKGTLKPEF